jgi:hypothetical protein
MAANLRSHLLGAETHLNAGDVRWLSPLPLWAGILAGPTAWALNLGTNYALVQWACTTHNHTLLHLIAIAALAVVGGGAVLSWVAYHRTADDASTEGERPRQRARFMAVLGLMSSSLFALQILAGAIPIWVLDACQ